MKKSIRATVENTKVFNENRDPYQQLLKHEGRAIVFVSDITRYGRGKTAIRRPDRVRVISTCLSESASQFCFLGDTDSWEESCFAADPYGNPYTYEIAIRRMKDFDKNYDLEIIHIEFH